MKSAGGKSRKSMDTSQRAGTQRAGTRRAGTRRGGREAREHQMYAPEVEVHKRGVLLAEPIGQDCCALSAHADGGEVEAGKRGEAVPLQARDQRRRALVAHIDQPVGVR